MPGRHCDGTVTPIDGHSYPAGQATGAACALVGQYLPGGHVMHAVALVAVLKPWYVPAGHGVAAPVPPVQ